eukprot:675924-Prorocentrum_minimum.AAC.2
MHSTPQIVITIYQIDNEVTTLAPRSCGARRVDCSWYTHTASFARNCTWFMPTHWSSFTPKAPTARSLASRALSVRTWFMLIHFSSFTPQALAARSLASRACSSASSRSRLSCREVCTRALTRARRSARSLARCSGSPSSPSSTAAVTAAEGMSHDTSDSWGASRR